LEIKKLAKNQGMTTMIEDGLHKAREGLTTIEEVLRVIHE
jgi:type IV pilus assembly protein PilB